MIARSGPDSIVLSGHEVCCKRTRHNIRANFDWLVVHKDNLTHGVGPDPDPFK
jgi:hypothetical protein